MPHLVPFYYINEITFAFFAIGLILFLLSNYVLPNVLRSFVSRMYIVDLLTKKS